MKTWPEFDKTDMIEFTCEDPHEQDQWTSIFERTFAGTIDTWDYQWVYACWSQNGLSILPDSNLVSNIGFGPDATHTTAKSVQEGLPTTDIWDITHPPFVVRHREADAYTFNHNFGGKRMRESDNVRGKIRQCLSTIKWKAKSWL